MNGPVSRRDLLGKAVAEGLRILGNVAGAGGAGEAPRPGNGSRRDDVAAIAGDFTPDMLAMEAHRLGLDPATTDRETLLAAILDAMDVNNETNGPEGPEK